jgi:hypothetical protein
MFFLSEYICIYIYPGKSAVLNLVLIKISRRLSCASAAVLHANWDATAAQREREREREREGERVLSGGRRHARMYYCSDCSAIALTMMVPSVPPAIIDCPIDRSIYMSFQDALLRFRSCIRSFSVFLYNARTSAPSLSLNHCRLGTCSD